MIIKYYHLCYNARCSLFWLVWLIIDSINAIVMRSKSHSSHSRTATARDISVHFRRGLMFFLWQDKLPRLPINEELAILIPICWKSTYSKLFTMPPSSQLAYPSPEQAIRKLNSEPSSSFSASFSTTFCDFEIWVWFVEPKAPSGIKRCHGREATLGKVADGVFSGSVGLSRGIPLTYASFSWYKIV